MNSEEFDKILTSIDEKLGEETFGIISDDIANLMSYNEALTKNIEEKDKRIEKLNKKTEMLVEANGNLLQKVASGVEEKKKEIKEEEKPKIDIRTAFDKNGNFIK